MELDIRNIHIKEFSWNSLDLNYSIFLDWGPYCGDDCPGSKCTINPDNICQMKDRLGGCNGQYKSYFEKACQKTCGYCQEEGMFQLIK